MLVEHFDLKLSKFVYIICTLHASNVQLEELAHADIHLKTQAHTYTY